MKQKYPFTFYSLTLLARLPLCCLRSLGKTIGVLAYLFSRKRRHITYTNLHIAFPELDERALNRLVKQHLQAMGISLTDRIWLWFAPLNTVYKRITLVGQEHIPIQTSNTTPTILLMPHFVGLDAAMPALDLVALTDKRPTLKLTVIFQPQKSRWEDTLFRHGRGRFTDITQFTRRDGIRPIIKAMKSGRYYCCLPDNDFGAKDAIFVPFFGKPAATLTVLPRLNKLMNAQIVPVNSQISPTGYRVEFFPAWTGLEALSDEEVCHKMNRWIESQVKPNPAEYLFSHRRYKTRPAGEPAVY